jgi:hypothetical protein
MMSGELKIVFPDFIDFDGPAFGDAGPLAFRA